jgi:putative glycosyltransferase (TIGR04372 family)
VSARDLAIRALYIVPALVIRALGWRLLRLTNVHRIGHLAGEVDCLVKEERLGLFPPLKGLLLAPRGGVANEHLVTYWSRLIRTVRSPWLCRLLFPANRFRFARMRDDMACYVAAINQTAESMRIQKLWGSRPGVLALTEEDQRRGESLLRLLGVPAGARFVCFHSREGGYSPWDEHLHDFRNTSVENYLAAAVALFERGVYSIRLGDPSMKKLPQLPGVVDYAHSALRAEWMDIFLCGRCEFFIGSSSGLSFVAGAFGRPSCLANLIPFSGAFPYGAQDIGIPKLLWSRREQRLLGFAEILGAELADFRVSALYADRGIEPRENAAEDIRDLALEMLARTERRATYGPEDEALQQRLRALMHPGHFSYGSAARVGRDFLRKYAHLLEEGHT